MGCFGKWGDRSTSMEDGIPRLHLHHHLSAIVNSSWRFLVKSSGKLILLLCRSSMVVINVTFVVLRVILHEIWLELILVKLGQMGVLAKLGVFM